MALLLLGASAAASSSYSAAQMARATIDCHLPPDGDPDRVDAETTVRTAQDGRILVDAYYRSLEFNYRLLKNL